MASRRWWESIRIPGEASGDEGSSRRFIRPDYRPLSPPVAGHPRDPDALRVGSYSAGMVAAASALTGRCRNEAPRLCRRSLTQPKACCRKRIKGWRRAAAAETLLDERGRWGCVMEISLGAHGVDAENAAPGGAYFGSGLSHRCLARRSRGERQRCRHQKRCARLRRRQAVAVACRRTR